MTRTRTYVLRYVKIVSCIDDYYWYANKIGEIFPVLDYGNGCDFEVAISMNNDIIKGSMLDCLDCIDATDLEVAIFQMKIEMYADQSN